MTNLKPHNVLPHGKGMRLLTGAGELVDGWLSYLARLSSDMSIVDRYGVAPAEVGLEIMAQACGMLSADAYVDGQATPRVGVIGAVRGYRYSAEPFRVGEAMRVRVKADVIEDSIVVCEGELYRDGAAEAAQRARITLIITEREVS